MFSKFNIDVTSAIKETTSLASTIINLAEEVKNLRKKLVEIQPILVQLAKIRAAELQPESMEEYEKDESVQLYKKLLTLTKVD